MEQDYKKDYSLLRPFDLEAAKDGALLCGISGQLQLEFIAGPDASGSVCVAVDGNYNMFWTDDLRLAPLAWVEGKPVYKGDGPIYSKIAPQSGQVARCDGEWLVIQSGDFEYRTTAENFTWTRPRVKREIKLAAFIDHWGELRWVREELFANRGLRVPSDDKVIEVEDPAGQVGGAE